MFEFEIAPMFLALVPVAMVIVSVLKPYTGSYWSPVVALLSGIGLVFIVGDESLGEELVAGIIVGASAAGIFSGGKRMLQ